MPPLQSQFVNFCLLPFAFCTLSFDLLLRPCRSSLRGLLLARISHLAGFLGRRRATIWRPVARTICTPFSVCIWFIVSGFVFRVFPASFSKSGFTDPLF